MSEEAIFSVEMVETFGRSELHPNPAESTQCSPDPLAGGEGGLLPQETHPLSAFGSAASIIGPSVFASNEKSWTRYWEVSAL